MLKAGLIGVGAISKVHRDAYTRLAKEGVVELVACCDIRPECLEYDDLAGCRKYTSVDEMLSAEADKLDFVDICVPTFLHSEVAVKAMEAGLNVISEKPMARTVEQAQEMIDASKRTKKTLMIAYCNRFNALMDHVKAVVDSGELGRVRSADFWRGGGSRDPMGWNNWFRDGELSGGATLDLHIHDVDMIRYLFGVPKAVSMAAGTDITISGYDYLSANFIYGDGVFAHAACDWVTCKNRFNTRSYRVNFDGGYIFVDRSKGRECCVKVLNDGTETDLSELMKDVGNMYYNEIAYFADCIKNGLVPEKSLPEETIDSVRMVMAEIASADSDGTRVEL